MVVIIVLINSIQIFNHKNNSFFFSNKNLKRYFVAKSETFAEHCAIKEYLGEMGKSETFAGHCANKEDLGELGHISSYTSQNPFSLQ